MKHEATRMGIPYEKKGRVLVWHDEFVTPEIDRTVWCFDRTMDSCLVEYCNDERHIRQGDGRLHMQVHKSEKPGCRVSTAEGFCTKEGMNFKYGYLELRAKAPYRRGAWPSFWMKSNTPFAKAPYMAEIDIYEIFSSQNEVVSNLHKWTAQKHEMIYETVSCPCRSYRFTDWENLNDEYHVYGFEWDPRAVKFYVDDKCYFTADITETGDFGRDAEMQGMAGFHDFAYPIFNNEVYADGSASPPPGCILQDSDPLPIDYYLDYIRLYQNPATEELKLGPEIAAEKAKSR